MMRTPIAMGLLTLALIPLAAERSFQANKATAETTEVAITEASMRETIQSMLFTAERNYEIEDAMARVALEREAQLVAAQNQEAEAATVRSNTYRAEYAFTAARNAEIDASVALHESQRTGAAFAKARNKEINIALARYEVARDALFVAARNSEIEAAEARRLAVFTAERQAEIELASEAAAQRRQFFAELLSSSMIETGSLPHACLAAVQN